MPTQAYFISTFHPFNCELCHHCHAPHHTLCIAQHAQRLNERKDQVGGVRPPRRLSEDEMAVLAGGGGAALAAEALSRRRVVNLRGRTLPTDAPAHAEVVAPREQPLVTAKSSPEPTAVSPCEIVRDDALSAVSRAKTPQCRSQIEAATCAAMSGTLYPELHPNNPESCKRPLPRDGKALLATPLNGVNRSNEPIRIAFLIVCHGRSVRQVRSEYE
jgi:hypothetical protein